jgi:uncharacterized repeat protein (TIGR01451 family)
LFTLAFSYSACAVKYELGKTSDRPWTQQYQIGDTIVYSLTLTNVESSDQESWVVDIWDRFPNGTTRTLASNVYLEPGESWTGSTTYKIDVDDVVLYRGNLRVTNQLSFSGVTDSGMDVEGSTTASSRVLNYTIDGVKYNDLNGNGVRDTGEPGISGWKIELVDADTNSVMDTQTTNSNGQYSFVRVLQRNYTVREVFAGRTGWVQTEPAAPGVYTFNSLSEDKHNVNFGNRGSLKISGAKYNDLNGNGAKNSGELGLQGWTITLSGTTNLGRSVSLVQTTNASGSYNFSNLENGTYQVTESLKPGWINTAPLFRSVTLLGSDAQDIDFYNNGSLYISGAKYDDLDGSGTRSSGDVPISGWRIALSGTTSLGRDVSVVATTGADGGYNFTHLENGTYHVTESTRPGWIGTSPVSRDITLSGSSFGEINFFNRGSLKINGTKYNDLDSSGSLTSGDVPLSGWTITLTGTAESGGQVLRTSVTGPGGNYSFENLENGTYQVSESLKPGWINTAPLSRDIALSGSNISEIDFFNRGNLKISGAKYNDLDGSGSLTTGDVPLSGWTITLKGTTSAGATISVTTVTDSGGNYSFENLENGTYQVHESLKPGWINTSLATRDADLSGLSLQGVDFFNRGSLTISGTKYNDLDADGTKDAEDFGISGWTISLAGTTESGRPVSHSQITASNGSYSFANLENGTYTVSETLKPSWINSGPTTRSVTLTGTGAQDIDFFNHGNLSVSGTKYNDLDSSGSLTAGDVPLPGWTITIKGTTEFGKTISKVTVTDSSGNYTFTGLENGTYQVHEDLLLGWTNTAPATLDVILSGESLWGIDFFNRGSLSIEGKKYDDADLSHGYSTGDIALSGWTITLSGTTGLGRHVSYTQTTDSSGRYNFSALENGTYQITETSKPSWINTTPDTTTVVLSGTSTKDINFFNAGNLTISGKKYNDLDSSGSLTAGDVPLPGWTITLTGTTATGRSIPVVSKVTGADGSYSFTNLENGTYQVHETLKSGWINTSSVNRDVTLSGSSFEGIDFFNTGNLKISGAKYNDLDSSGSRTSGDVPLSGWTITLSGSTASGGSVHRTQTTDLSGAYSFTNLENGTYTVTEALKPSWINTSPVSRSVSVVGLDLQGIDFFNRGNLRINGTKYNDLDGSGSLTAGDVPLPGWTIILSGTTATGRTISQTQVTDADGAYAFTNLENGTYQVHETLVTGWMNTALISRDVSLSGSNAQEVDFFNRGSLAISGTKYNDLNGNGMYGSGDQTLSGWTITLSGTTSLGRPVLLTAVTGAGGSYSFQNLENGNYHVSETLRPGWTNVGPVSQDVSLVGSSVQGVNFFNRGNLSVSGTKYNDLDSSGSLTAGDVPLPGWTIILSGTTDSGRSVSTTKVTGADGSYAFTNVENGTYQVREILNSGWINTTPLSINMALAGAGAQGVDFFNRGNLSVSGTKYSDLDASGSLTAGDVSLPGWTITLSGTTSLGRTVSSTAVTGSDGSYSFTMLEVGEYHISEALKPGWLNTTPTTRDVSLSGSNAQGIDFFNRGNLSVSGTKYNDLDSSGSLTAGDIPLSGWTITLSGTAESGAHISKAVTTGADGAYAFSNLENGTYTVSETLKPGWINTAPVTRDLSLSGVDVLGIDFFNRGSLSINGTKYNDLDSSGTFTAGDVTLSGWTITLSGTTDSGRSVLLTAVTGTDGAYSFGNLENGTYTVSETLKSGWANTAPASRDLTLSGSSFEEINFFNRGSLSINGTKYNDLDSSGTLTAGDVTLSGWTIVLTGTTDLGRSVSLVMVTGSGGSYSFENLENGTYQVSEALKPGWVNTAQATIDVVLSESSVQAINFFNRGSLSINGTKYNDLDSSGSLTAGDVALSGWTIILSGTSEYGRSVSLTAVTDADGAYSFENLENGTYTVSEALKPGWTNTAPISRDLTLSGSSFEGINFFNRGNLRINGTKYNDLDSSGSLTTGDVPLSSWTISLSGTTGSGRSVLLTAITDTDGDYAFTNLENGTYTVSEALKPGWTNTAPVQRQVSLAGSSLWEIDFFNRGNLSVSGTKYNDLDSSGGLSSGDVTLSGWTITLTGTADSGRQVSEVTSTGPDGSYSFANLENGTYQVEEVLKADWINTTQIARSIALAGSSVQEIDFFNRGSLTIEGTKYNDLDANGALSPGDVPLSGWTIALEGTTDLGRSVSRTAVTDLSGHYSFVDLENGTYTVSETLKPGWANVGPVTRDVVLSGSGSHDVDFFNRGSLTISGTKYDDLDSSGSLTAGDIPLSGWMISLSGTTATGRSVLLTAATGSDGAYSFENLENGTYTVSESLKPGWANTAPISRDLALSGTSAQGVDFFNRGSLEINGIKYNDLDGTGSLTTGDIPLSGWTITLFGTTDSGRSILMTAVTGADGAYSFENLENGTYQVSETLKSGWANTAPASREVGLAGTSFEDIDFFNRGNLAVSGIKYDDLDGTGSLTSGDIPLSGWTITLFGTADSGRPISLATVTGPDGNYSFENLENGTYTVSESLKPGWVSTSALDQSVALSGTSVQGINFFNRGNLWINGTKYNDLDSSGSLTSGDLALSGWTITLTGTADSGRSVSLTRVTGSDGAYSFENLENGTYTVSEMLKPGWTNTAPAQRPVSLSGMSIEGINFFNAGNLAISGTKYNDLDSSGTLTSGDVPLQGWTITLSGSTSTGRTVSRTQMTDASGHYSFANLENGTYQVTEDIRPFWTNTAPTSMDVTLQGTSVQGINFFNRGTLIIEGTKYNDLDSDGALSADDIPISGWTIALEGTTDLGRQVSLTKTTDASGHYSFASLENGTYTVSEALKPGWINTSSITRSVILSGANVQEIDFFNRGDLAISGTKYNDLDANGALSQGDIPIQGWEITLSGTSDSGRVVSLFEITDENGNYAFHNLDNGTYTVSEASRPGWVSTSPASRSATLSGSSLEGIDFFNAGSLSISGTKYNDLDSTGSLTSGDIPLSGWTVVLSGTTDSGRTVSKTISTGADGSYTFANLENGTYQVSESLKPGWTNTAPLSRSVSLSGSNVQNIDFFNAGSLSISGTKYNDLDGTGSLTAGDVPLSGWIITLSGTSESGRQISREQTTGADGAYAFSNLENGTYTVSEALKPGWTNTAPVQRPVSLAGSSLLDIDFFNAGSLSISGTKFYDLGAAGTRDQSDPGIPGWTIYLDIYSSDGTSVTTTKTTTTGAGGLYTFGSLEPGKYVVREGTVDGWVQTYPGQGQSYTIDLEDSSSGNDFGNQGTMTISGSKHQDLGTIGQINDSDPGIGGWTIYLDIYDLSGEGLLATETATTDSNGAYSFGSLAPGRYVVREASSAGWTQTYPLEGTYDLSLASSRDDIDFGNSQESGISGSVLRDVNGDGDISDCMPLCDWHVELYKDGACCGTTASFTDGSYAFNNLSAGNYEVKEILSEHPGWIQTYPATRTYNVTLNSEAITGLDFANYVNASIEISKLANPAEGEKGTRVNFTITVTNTGLERLDSLKVSDLLPDGLAFSKATNGTQSGKSIIWDDLGSLEPDESRTIYLEASIDGTVFGTLVNTVAVEAVSAEGENVNDTASAEVVAKDSGIFVDKTSDIRSGMEGQEINFTIAVNNTAAVDLAPVVIADVLPAGLSYVSSTPAADVAGHSVTWTLDGLAQGESSKVYLVAKIDGTAFGTLTNVVTVTGTTPQGTNISSRDTLDITTLEPGINVTKVANPEVVEQGLNVSFAMNVCNVGACDLDCVMVRDVLPRGLAYVESGTYPKPDSVAFRADGCTVLTWSNISRLGVSGSCAVNLMCLVGADTPGVLTNYVEAIGDPDTDHSVFANDTADVLIRRSLNVTKTADKKLVNRGDEVVYTVKIENTGGLPVYDVLVKDVFGSNAEIISTSPESDLSGAWHIDVIGPHQAFVITIRARVPRTQTNFDMDQKVSGTGFVNVANDYSTAYEPYTLTNRVYVTSGGNETTVASESITVAGEPGTALKSREHGSGTYVSEDLTTYRSENKSIDRVQSLSARYQPTTFSLPGNRQTNYSSKWSDADCSKNQITGASISEEYRHATRIDRSSSLHLDDNGSTLVTEADFEGMGHIGTLKDPSCEATAKADPAYQSSEDLIGQFRIGERYDEYGKTVASDRSISGVGYVSSDKQIGDSQGSYESGTGSYESNESIRTHTNYMYKDLEATHMPVSYSLTPDVTLNQSIKWKEGAWSKSSGSEMKGGALSGACRDGTCPGSTSVPAPCTNATPVTYISREISDASYIKETSVARGISDLSTNATFSGRAEFKEILTNGGCEAGPVPEVEQDDVYIGNFTISRKAHLTGTSKYDAPHMTVMKDGTVKYGRVRYFQGTALSYVITVINDGSSDLQPVYVKDFFPSGTEFINSSVRPSEITDDYANWTLEYLPVGGYSEIELNLNVSKSTGEVLNRVEALGSYDGSWVYASNFSVIQNSWLQCCQPGISAIKTATIDPVDPSIVHYQIALRNRANYPIAAKVTDDIPEGMTLLNSSLEPDMRSGRAVWSILEVRPGEIGIIYYTAKALKDGSFTNLAHVEAHGLEGEGEAQTDASVTVVVDRSKKASEKSYTGEEWHPPEDWEMTSSSEGLRLWEV